MARRKASRPGRQWKALGRVGRYRHYRKRGAAYRGFDKRSIRTIHVGRHGKLLRVGCPKGSWDAKRGRCRVGLRALSLLAPAVNPQKQSWQMTLREFAGEEPPRVAGKDWYFQPEAKAAHDEWQRQVNIHFLQIADAMDAGKPVPFEAAADYPDLARRFKAATNPRQVGPAAKANELVDLLGLIEAHKRAEKTLRIIRAGGDKSLARYWDQVADNLLRRRARIQPEVLKYHDNPPKFTRKYVDLFIEQPARKKIGERRLGAKDKKWLMKYRRGDWGKFYGSYGLGQLQLHDLDKKCASLSHVPEGSLWRATKGDVDKVVAWLREHGLPQYAVLVRQAVKAGKLPPWAWGKVRP